MMAHGTGNAALVREVDCRAGLDNIGIQWWLVSGCHPGNATNLPAAADPDTQTTQGFTTPDPETTRDSGSYQKKYFKHINRTGLKKNFDSLVTPSSTSANVDKYRTNLLARKKRSQRRRIAGPLMRVAAGQAELRAPNRFSQSPPAAQFETVDRQPGEQ
ncbi:predicted protein [Chaetomium globosum CBS 148.51]|uniref:Uncharacterized protein n=1 Tax=Chaetomium globosum (strain ATCC 6205 / CBS 148.51 / DSM 1962 / NBRC 6347 / NRRL 1970) TaxID=306901 RepID=Q2GS40_CHAGB|nr:uncharacterized protein CHGG_09214 [Chaetomium globosum CBS 148.51]EAQ85200.1 predicted protein [Chaetomium globosum CBS 148.51]